MTNSKDLTRWNRASLENFRYVDGNAITYLELIRQELVEQYRNPNTGECDWITPGVKIPTNEKVSGSDTLLARQQAFRTKQERLLASYKQERQDWLWEISRTFARASHVLTEHIDTYANESFLGTATQWDNVRRLVEMLDYHPAPPASAYTPLVFIAKESERIISDDQLVINKGFQVKYTPPNGGNKIIFETLNDLQLEPKINALRPKDWDKSQLSNVDNGTEVNSSILYSFLADQEVIHIQGIGPAYAGDLDWILRPEKFLIKDFINFEPELAALSINLNRLWEWKAKAEVICFFLPFGDWSSVGEWLLIDISEKSVDYLVDFAGNSEADTEQFKLELEILKICVDNPFYRTLRLNQVLSPLQPIPGALKTYWKAPRKPKLKVDSIALICLIKSAKDKLDVIKNAQAAWVNHVEKESKAIHLTPSASQNTWTDWKQGESNLKVAPDWRRKPWLNGENVIRTVTSHGVSKGNYIGWLNGNDWQYAEVTKTDTRSIYIDFDGELPEKDALLYSLSKNEIGQFPADFEAISIINHNGQDIPPTVKPISPEVPAIPNLPFEVIDIETTTSSGGGLLPPASLPGIGSFLFPSPFLPIDLVKAAVELLLSLGIMVIPSTGKPVIKGLPPEGPLSLATDLDSLAGELVKMLNLLKTPDNIPMILWEDGLVAGDFADGIHESQLASLLTKLLDSPLTISFNEIEQDLSEEALGPLLIRPISSIHFAVVDSSQPQFLFNGKPDKIGPGDWVVAEYEEDVKALNIASIDATNDEYFSVEFSDYSADAGAIIAINANFVDAELSEFVEFNSQELGANDIELEFDVEGLLKVGQSVLLTGEGIVAVSAKLEKVEGHIIATNPKASGFKKGELVIRGNMVLAGHGESKPTKILGSGNATLSNQEFVLQVVDVSFIPDATKPSGVAAAIDVSVTGEIWQQVSTLKDSLPEDHHYEIRMTEEAFIKIIFGDGLNGRRLPTGKNNIRIAYRVGTGSEGILPLNILNTPVKPNALVEKILQPEPASGGGDMEDINSLKTNAPATLLALQRAVSLTDFVHLATAQSGIWQASAENQIINSGRDECVVVYIVPVNGVMTPTAKKQMTRFLQAHSLPNVIVKIGEYKPEFFDLDITLRINAEAFNFDDVVEEVITQIKSKFDLKNRKLGENFYLSEVYNLVESIEGVENSICLIDNSAGKQMVEARGLSCVVYLSLTGLAVRAEEFTI